MKILAPILALFLGACATPQPVEPTVRTAEMVPQKIVIQTYPAGGLIDLNGNVLGTSPVEMQVMPRNHAQWWPYEPNPSQTFRARWPNGAVAQETFWTNSPMPKQVGILANLNWFRSTTVAPLSITR